MKSMIGHTVEGEKEKKAKRHLPLVPSKLEPATAKKGIIRSMLTPLSYLHNKKKRSDVSE